MTLLDLGCGLGDLAAHIQTRRDAQQTLLTQQPRFPLTHVVGVDIVPEFIAHASARHPQHSFLCRDLLQLPATEVRVLLSEACSRASGGEVAEANSSIDFGVCSGMFAFGSERFFQRTLRLIVPLMRRAFAFNIHENEDARFLQMPRQKAVDLCAALPGVKQVEVFDGYWHQDYTVMVHKL